MAYTQEPAWKKGDVISSNRLNNMETGIREGLVRSNAIDSTATTCSATPYAVKTALDTAKSYTDSKIEALDKSDTAVSGQYVSAVSESNGVITTSRASFSPTLDFTEGTSSAVPTISINVASTAGSTVSLSSATTAKYGTTILSDAIDSTSHTCAATSYAVKTVYDQASAAYTHGVTNKGSAFSDGLYKIKTNAEGHVTGTTAVVKQDIVDLGIPAQDTVHTFATGNTNGTISVDGIDIPVKGLKEGAYHDLLQYEPGSDSDLPAPPISDGTYLLQLIVSNTDHTYQWVSAPVANGANF